MFLFFILARRVFVSRTSNSPPKYVAPLEKERVGYKSLNVAGQSGAKKVGGDGVTGILRSVALGLPNCRHLQWCYLLTNLEPLGVVEAGGLKHSRQMEREFRIWYNNLKQNTTLISIPSITSIHKMTRRAGLKE